MVKKREINLDFVRAMAVLFVVGGHFWDHTGLYDASGVLLPIRAAAVAGRMITGCTVGIFLILSGWLCSGKKFSARYYLGFLRIWEIFFISSLFTFAYQILVEHQHLTLSYMVGSIININSCPYAWYMLLYMGLFLMIPFLNLAFNGLETDRQRLVLVATFVYLAVLPSLLNTRVHLLSVWWKNLYPIAYYYTGAYLRRLDPKISAGKAFGLMFASVAAFVVFDFVYYGPSGDWTTTMVYHDSYQCYITAILCFLGLRAAKVDRLPEAVKRGITRVSELSFGVYLLSGITDMAIYPRFKEAVPPAGQIRWFLPVTLLSFVGALLLSQITLWLCVPLDKLLRGALLRCFPALRQTAGTR